MFEECWEWIKYKSEVGHILLLQLCGGGDISPPAPCVVVVVGSVIT